MTTISAKVIADSVNEHGNRLTTLRLHYPRWIHAEFMTHRVFSRNAASSRAIPVKRMIEAIRADPAVPMFWGANQKGMQAGAEHTGAVHIPYDWGRPNNGGDDIAREDAWLSVMEVAIEAATRFDLAGYHKQIVNRLLEPFMHIGVLVTATEYSNFFALRIHPAAEPHIRLLAERMKEAMDASVPEPLVVNRWHLPYISDHDWVRLDSDLGIEDLIKLSVARCAHLSYETVEGEPLDMTHAERIFGKLLGDVPIHASPAEHQATPDNGDLGFWGRPLEHGNLVGWRQYRKTLPGECQ